MTVTATNSGGPPAHLGEVSFSVPFGSLCSAAGSEKAADFQPQGKDPRTHIASAPKPQAPHCTCKGSCSGTEMGVSQALFSLSLLGRRRPTVQTWVTQGNLSALY